MPTPPRPADRLRLLPLEDRTVPAPLTALAANGTTLVSIDSDNPGVVISQANVTGLDSGATLVGIDYRASNGKLYGVSSNSRLYTLDPAGGAATPVGGTFSTALSGTVFGVDFNPAADKLRVISNTNQNLRVNADTGALAGTDTPQAYDPAAYEANVGGTPPTPVLVATAYTSDPPAAGTDKVTTTQYVIDSNTGLLSTQGTSSDNTGADLVSPNTGRLFPVDKLQFTPAASNVGFDIQPLTDLAFVTVGEKLFVVNPATAGTLSTAALAAGSNFRDIALVPASATPGAGTVAFAATAVSFPENGGPAVVTVTRTGGSSVAASVDFATGGGDAVPNVDYLPVTGTLTFDPGQTSRQIVVARPAGPPSVTAPARTLTVTLSNPANGATLGSNAVATLTIPAQTAVPRGKYLAAGAGVGGGPRVTVYDAATGTQVGTFFAYEPTFTGGVTVATADFTNDGVDDVAVGSGVGGGPRVRIFDGATLSSSTPTVVADFFAYESTFRGGVNVAAGDVTGDGTPDLAIGSGVGGGPRVRVISGRTALAGSSDPAAVADFFAYEDTFRGGVTVAVGEVTGDNQEDIVAGSGVGGGPRVRVFNATVLGTGSTPAALADFFAYESSFRNGVNVATGVVTPDSRRSILTGSGTGGGPAVGIFNAQTGASVGSFFAYDQNLRGGVRVAAADFGADGFEEIVTASGPGGPPTVRFLSSSGAQVAALSPYENSYLGGVFVG